MSWIQPQESQRLGIKTKEKEQCNHPMQRRGLAIPKKRGGPTQISCRLVFMEYNIGLGELLVLTPLTTAPFPSAKGERNDLTYLKWRFLLRRIVGHGSAVASNAEGVLNVGMESTPREN